MRNSTQLRKKIPHVPSLIQNIEATLDRSYENDETLVKITSKSGTHELLNNVGRLQKKRKN